MWVLIFPGWFLSNHQTPTFTDWYAASQAHEAAQRQFGYARLECILAPEAAYELERHL